LDEPSTGLDPRQRERLWEFVLGLAGAGTTVIYSTHHLLEAERYGDRLLVLADGERVFDGSAAELHAAVPGSEATDFEGAFVRFLRERGH
jgi:ABC-2 type transport system ATP-binding protein